MVIDKQSEAGAPLSKKRFWRFSLRTLLILLTLFCVWLGMLASSARRQKRAVEAIQQSGGQFCYDYQLTRRGPGLEIEFSYQVQPPGPRWLRRILGDHYFITPLALNIARKSSLTDDCFSHLDALPFVESASFVDVAFQDSDLAHLKHLTNLRALGFLGRTRLGRTTSSRFEFLRHLRKLEMLGLSGERFGDDDVKYLSNALNLKFLTLYNSDIGDAGVAQLQHLNNLEMIGLSGTSVTDRGIGYLSSLPKLRYLSANDLNITDSAFDSFIKMTALCDLELSNTRVSPEGIDRLRKAMPKCVVNGKDSEGNSRPESLFGGF
jgi:hypothetical protein